MRLMLILLSVITINCQNVNENSTTQSTVHFLPVQMALGSSGDNDDGLHGSVLGAGVNKEDIGDSSQQHSTFHVTGSGTGSIIDVGGGSGTSSDTGNGGASSSSGSNSDTTRSRVIETKYGRVQGLSITIAQGRNNPLKNKIVEVYLGLPYASPPIKSHRFGPTQTAVPWDGIRDAIKPGFVCPQMMPDIRNETAALKEMPKGYLEYLKKVEPYLRNQSEDCLYLNIYTPIGPEPKVRPVVVWIHGGKFSWGSGNLSDGTVLAAYGDVVFVSLNFRLNVLGFLNVNALPNSKPRVANYGLMDQIAALHWIKENILSFGGDPESISLIGYESGAACINYLMASPAVTPGLFHRAILIAGSAHAPNSLVTDPYASATALAQSLNCSSSSSTGSNSSTPSGNSSHTSVPAPFTSSLSSSRDGKHSSSSSSDPVFECLKNKHFSEFQSVSPPKFSIDFGPSIDGVVVRSNFRASEAQMGKRAEVSKRYDLLFGLSSLEKTIAFSENDLQFGFEAQRRDAILRTLVRNSYRFHLNEILAVITNEYTDFERSSQHPISTRDLTVNAVTDALTVSAVVAASESNLIKRSFFYVFDYATAATLHHYSAQGQRSGGVAGEELMFFFGHPLVESLTGTVLPFIPSISNNFSKSEQALSELLITYLGNFAHSGDPNGPIKIDTISSWPVSKERRTSKSNTPWEGYDRLHQKYLEISASKIKSRSHYRAHQMAIWLRLVPELQRNGAQFASGLHNRMKGGNDPSLYVGKIRGDGEDPLLHSPSILDIMGYREELIDSAGLQQGSSSNSSGPPTPPTTCFSPLASSSPSLPISIAKLNESLEPSFFSPYSTALSVTIAIGCSLLIVNVMLFAIVYYRRDKQSMILKSQSSLTKKYGEPPELLKSNSTTCTSIHHQQSTDSCQSGGGDPIGQTNFGSPMSQSSQQLQQQQHTQQQIAQQALAQRGILLSPTQAQQGHHHHHLMHHHSSGQLSHFPSNTMAVATLPRSNGGVNMGISNLPKPPPPPRSFSNFSTLPHNLNRSNQNLNYSSNFDELKV